MDPLDMRNSLKTTLKGGLRMWHSFKSAYLVCGTPWGPSVYPSFMYAMPAIPPLRKWRQEEKLKVILDYVEKSRSVFSTGDSD